MTNKFSIKDKMTDKARLRTSWDIFRKWTAETKTCPFVTLLSNQFRTQKFRPGKHYFFQ